MLIEKDEDEKGARAAGIKAAGIKREREGTPAGWAPQWGMRAGFPPPKVGGESDVWTNSFHKFSTRFELRREILLLFMFWRKASNYYYSCFGRTEKERIAVLNSFSQPEQKRAVVGSSLSKSDKHNAVIETSRSLAKSEKKRNAAETGQDVPSLFSVPGNVVGQLPHAGGVGRLLVAKGTVAIFPETRNAGDVEVRKRRDARDLSAGVGVGGFRGQPAVDRKAGLGQPGGKAIIYVLVVEKLIPKGPHHRSPSATLIISLIPLSPIQPHFFSNCGHEMKKPL